MNNQHNEQARFEQFLKDMSSDGTLMYAGTLLERAFHLFPERTALIYEDTYISYRQLYLHACACALMLRKAGVVPGDHVIMSMHNSPSFYITYFAIWHLGAIVVPVNTFLVEKELTHIIKDSQPKIAIVDKERKEMFDTLGSDIPIITEQEIQDAHTSDDIMDIVIREPDELCALLYTSGTTGVPKGTMLSSRNIMTNIAQVLSRVTLEYDQHDRSFAVLPLFHVFAQNTCVWTSIYCGISIIVVPKIDRRAILHGLAHKPTLFLGVPALYGLLCLMKTAPLDSVRLFISGGDALPDKIRSGFELIYRRRLCNGYGLTETSPVIAAALEDEAMETNTIGKPLPGIECEIRDEWGDIAKQGESGQLWVRGDNVMLGYYNAPELTERIMQDGFLNTGDLAYVDTQGRLVISGREKDIIKHKGVIVYPQEIENVIMLHPNVLAVGVVGLPNPDVGEYVIAFVQLRTQQQGIEAELKKLCMQHCAPYKVPRKFICDTAELPMTSTRKVDKKVLRQRLSEFKL